LRSNKLTFKVRKRLGGGSASARVEPGRIVFNTTWSALRSMCIRYSRNVAFFFKQWGGANKKIAGRRFRGKTWDEYPDRIAAP
jgi:protein gp37